MRLGLQVNNFTWPGHAAPLGETFGRIAERAEAAGFDSLWVMDHFFQIPNIGPVEHEMLEGWSALAFAAGRTSAIRLGTMVTGVTYRHPTLLVKTATTLDVLSGGRAYLGVGAAWFEEEHRGLGVPYPPLAERFERLEETLRIAHRMLAGDDSAFEGTHYRPQRLLNSPLPVQRPRPPILVGGGGERKTLRLVARYADACNLFARADHTELRHKLAVLRDHCDAAGRPYAEIEKTTLHRIDVRREGGDSALTPAAAVEQFHELAELGVDHAIVSMAAPQREGSIELIGEAVAPAVHALAVAGR